MVLFLTLTIFISIPYVPKIWMSLELVQQKLAINILYCGFVLAGIVLSFILFRRKNHSLLRFCILLILSYCYVETFLSLHRFPAEKFHLIEYGMLSIFSFSLFVRENSGITAIIKAFFYTFYISILDEAIQWIVPGRVGTYEDIMINIKSAALSLAVVAAVAFPLKASARIKTMRMEIKEVVLCCFSAVILSGVFLYYVHEFGYEIRYKNIYFYSSLSKEHLADISEKLIKNKELIKDSEIKKALNEKKTKYLKGDKKDAALFLSERYTHLIERNIALAKDKKEKAFFEKEIVYRYYSISHTAPVQEKEKHETIEDRIYKSPVKSDLIVSFSKSQLVFICFSLGGILLILGLLI